MFPVAISSAQMGKILSESAMTSNSLSISDRVFGDKSSSFLQGKRFIDLLDVKIEGLGFDLINA